MKKKLLLGLIACTGFLLAGCAGREKPEEYLNTQLKALIEAREETTENILNLQIEEEGIVDFPEELRADYAAFLAKGLPKVECEVKDVEKDDKNNYTAHITIHPLAIDEMTTAPVNEYLSQPHSVDALQEEKAVLELLQSEFEDPILAEDSIVVVDVSWNKDHYEVAQSDWEKVQDAMMEKVLAPYNLVADAFSVRNYVQARLDMGFKGDVADYAAITGITEEEALAQYQEQFEVSEGDMEVLDTEETMVQYTDGLKAIIAATPYEVGAPVKVEENHYTFDITVTPNESMNAIMNEVEASATAGAYSSEEELVADVLAKINEKAKSPVLGTPKVVTIHVQMLDNNNLGIVEEDENRVFDTALADS